MCYVRTDASRSAGKTSATHCSRQTSSCSGSDTKVLPMKRNLTVFTSRRLAWPAVVVWLGLAGVVHGEEPFEAFLEKHCVRCHGPKKAEGDVRVDRLSRDFK